MSYRLMVVVAWVFCFSACGDDTKPPAADSQVAIPDRNLGDRSLPDRGLPDKSLPDKSLIDYRPCFDATPPECPQHTAISPHVTCVCFGVFVYNVAVQFPDCKAPMEMHCCPGTQSPNCETPGQD